jgi:hypothetical protein
MAFSLPGIIRFCPYMFGLAQSFQFSTLYCTAFSPHSSGICRSGVLPPSPSAAEQAENAYPEQDHLTEGYRASGQIGTPAVKVGRGA